jgi:hypothetical protein
MVNAVTGLGAASTCDPTASAASPELLDSASSSGVPVSEAPALLPVPAWEPEEGPPLAADVPLEPEPENELLPEDPPDPPEPAATLLAGPEAAHAARSTAIATVARDTARRVTHPTAG